MLQREIRALNSIARSHYDWTAESFVRVLALTEWGESEVSERIDAEYEREIPRLYRAIERIDELGGHADMNLAPDYAEHLPRVGRDRSEMLAREADSLGGFQPTLEALCEALADAGEDVGAAIARDALATRAKYVDWAARTMTGAAGDCKRRLAPAPPDGRLAWKVLLRLYAQLAPAIEETIVHMLLLRRSGRIEAARSSWRDSFAYMMYAADAVRLLARRNWSFEFSAAQPVPPRVGATAEEAIASNESRHAALAAETRELSVALAGSGDAEAEAICRNAAGYLAARARKDPGSPPREAPDFAAMLAREEFHPNEAV